MKTTRITSTRLQDSGVAGPKGRPRLQLLSALQERRCSINKSIYCAGKRWVRLVKIFPLNSITKSRLVNIQAFVWRYFHFAPSHLPLPGGHYLPDCTQHTSPKSALWVLLIWTFRGCRQLYWIQGRVITSSEPSPTAVQVICRREHEISSTSASDCDEIQIKCLGELVVHLQTCCIVCACVQFFLFLQ